MMEIIGYIASIGIGISLGLIGGGGSILTVPVLVYLFHVEPLLATSYSLFVVGSTSMVGAIPYFKNKLIDFRTALYFGIPSIITVFLTRHYLINAIPDNLFEVGGIVVTKNMAIMLFFALLMLFASYNMIKSKEIPQEEKPSRIIPLLIQGAAVGLISGLVGAGGGFLIIPALIIFGQMTMKKAVGTSLLIISANSLIGFLGKMDVEGMNWGFMLGISGIAIVGILIGARMSQRIDGKKLKPAFGWFVLAMATLILLQELSK
ncbi:sulfite exporter TauE/SafE family protein [Sphingobacterium kyonggiense]